MEDNTNGNTPDNDDVEFDREIKELEEQYKKKREKAEANSAIIRKWFQMLVERAKKEGEIDTITPLRKLTKDAMKGVDKLSKTEVRFIVDLYYQVQNFRIAMAGQIRSMFETEEPTDLLVWSFMVFDCVEGEMKHWLDGYTDREPSGMGKWAKQICGIGPVLSAGLVANTEIKEIQGIAGHLWRFMGMDPTSHWVSQDEASKLVAEVAGKSRTITFDHVSQCALRLNRNPQRVWKQLTDIDKTTGKPGKVTRERLIRNLKRRPWNASLKTLGYKIGESFVKVQNNTKDIYGKLFAYRKQLEMERNKAGMFKGQAEYILKTKKIGKTTKAYKFYSKGLLPPAHIHSRARRWAVKLFIAHYVEEMYVRYYNKKPPKPYVMDNLGHVDKIERPNATQPTSKEDEEE